MPCLFSGGFMQECDLKQERKYCSRLGLALTLVMLWALAWQFGLALIDQLLPVPMPDGVYYVLMLVGHYAVSLPAAYALCRSMPRLPFCRETPAPRRMGRWLVIGLSMMFFGSLLGTAANNMAYRLSGREPVDLVGQAMGQLSPGVVLLVACIIGPICEELLFRGLLAGRLARYGQKPGALVSALLFGLFHANLEQFFYAFLLGLLLAYAYYRTGSLGAPIVLHMLYNLFGSGIPVLLVPTVGMALLYSVAWLAVAVTGLVLLVRGRRAGVWLHGPCPPAMGAVFGNAGMLLAVVICFVQLAVNFVLV